MKRLLDFIFPRLCLACSVSILGERASLGLCPDCRQGVAEAPVGCRRCGRSLGAEPSPRGLCGSCRPHPPAYSELLALWTYQNPLDQVIQGLKFRRLDYLGQEIGDLLLHSFRPRLQNLELVVSMPLGPWRRLRRGFNQSERIARPIAQGLDLPLSPLLRRKDRRRQLGLSREDRLRNLESAFRVRPLASGRRILLVDDVATTGATLQAAASALRQAGAKDVVALVAARRSPPHAPTPR